MDSQPWIEQWNSLYPDACVCGGEGCPTCRNHKRCPRCGHPLNHELGRCPGCNWLSARIDLSQAWRDLLASGALEESLSLDNREVMEYLKKLPY